ncbi:hypothetical protein QWZ08_20035 [Ferruginibacter paludis]|uniref:hypothetical protein n=1 Tax=Ferruginibacter paludis TaxID=1310417 RepID=UPI0025B2C035|nr:hypothetical protein [Ferruginibacter paludis]MDN3657954.1 hypothetical protein [Ferruginibacter paludis]
MQEPKTFDDFLKWSDKLKCEWLDTLPGLSGQKAGIVVEPGLDLFLYFERNSLGKITFIKIEKFTEVQRRHRVGNLANKAMANMN